MDNIKQRLAEIDKQLSRSLAYYFSQTISTGPLVFCALGMIAGIILQNTFNLPALLWLSLAFCLTFFLVLCFFIKTNRVYAAALLAVACFVCLGAIRLAKFNQPGPNDIRNLVGDEPNLATVRGVIVSAPYTDGNDWKFSRFTHTDPGSSFYLEVRQVESVKGWVNASGIVRVRVNEPLLDLKVGDYIQMFCWLDRFGPATNPGEFDIAKYLARKGVFVGASVDSRQAIELLQTGQERLLTRIRTRLSAVATQRLTGELPTEDPTGGLVEALLLGSRGNIGKDVYKAFGETGLLHFISLSGMHLAIIAGIGWWLGKLAGLMKRGQAAVCIITVVLFALTVPPRDPTVRAAIIVIVFCASFFFRRRPSSLNSLSLAAIILLLARPTGLFEAGWQLSFASVLGILAFCRRIHFPLYNKIAGHPWIKDYLTTMPFFRIVAKPGPAILALFTTGLSAWMGSAGILLYHFYTINPLTSIWTVAAFPFVVMILAFGFLKILLSFVLPTIAGWFGAIVSFFAGSLIWIVKFIAGLNISEILIGHTPVWLIVLYYALVLFAGFSWFKRPAFKRIAFTFTTIVILLSLGAIEWQKTYRENLTVVALDVGHGQAILARLPEGTNFLFDSGSSTRNDIGTRVVGPFLRYNGIRCVDALVISHGDIDHINGIPEVNDNCRIKSFYASGALFRDSRPTAVFLKNLITINDINTLPGPALIKTLWPTSDVLENNLISENDKALVILIEYAGRRILISSDIEKFAQMELLTLYPDLKADVLIAPHHGSAKTLQREFLEAIQPKVVICSCAKSACEKRQVINCGEEFRSFYTGTDGAVTIRINNSGIIETDKFRKEQNPLIP